MKKTYLALLSAILACIPFINAQIPADGHVTDIKQIREYFSPDKRALDLTARAIRRIDDKVFEQIAENATSLRWLSLGHNFLTRIPDSLWNLRHLRNLFLGYNQLTDLQEGISNLKHLRILDLKDNKLERIPDGIGSLSKLKILHLSRNKITTVPDSLKNLSCLQELVLADNKIKSFSDTFFEFLFKVEELNLAGNQLTHLPESIGNLSQLKQLNLLNNQLTHLPESFCHLCQLQELVLSHNQLTRLPQSFKRLSSLQQLLLDGNPLVARTNWAIQKLNLQQNFSGLLLISDNLPTPPTPLPAIITNISQIIMRKFAREVFMMKHTACCYDLATNTINLSNLPIEVIDPTVLEQIVDFWPNLEIINLSNTPLARSPELSESFCTNLYILIEQGAPLKKVLLNTAEAENVINFFEITDLDQIMCGYRSIGKFGDITDGAFLLANERIRAISDRVFEQIAQSRQTADAQALLLMGNPLKTLSSTVTHLTKLRTINLEDTLIKSLPMEIFLMSTLRRLSLTNTPLSQNEEFAVFRTGIDERRASLGLEPLDIITRKRSDAEPTSLCAQ